MSTIRHLPLAFSSCQPLQSVSDPLASSNRLFNKSKGERDYRTRTRIQFPGGWNNRRDEIFRWYDSQPYRHFQEIEYCKERSGVQHEFIRILLQDDNGDEVDAFCRIERVADVERRIEAVSNRGTAAFDIIQTINPDDPLDSEQPDSASNSDVMLVARISFPCVFDLLDILAICYGIHRHPQARNYTLQQFNCYFFCWTIILSLARHAVDWTGLLRDHTGTLRDDIMSHMDQLHSSRRFTVWSVMFGLHDTATNDSPLHHGPSYIAERILSEVTSQVLAGVLMPLLWHDQGPTKLQERLRGILEIIAQDTSSPTLKNMLINSGKKSSALASWGFGLFHSELTRICATSWWKTFSAEDGKLYTQELKAYHTRCAQHMTSSMRTKSLSKALSRAGLFVISSPVAMASGTAVVLIDTYEHEIAIQRQGATRTYLRRPLAFLNTAVHAPKVLCSGLESYRRKFIMHYDDDLCESAIDLKGAPPFPTSRSPWNLDTGIRVLNESLNIYSARHREYGADELREACKEAMEYFCRVGYRDGLQHNLRDLWVLSFTDDIGSIIAQSILNIVGKSTDELTSFEWILEPADHHHASRSGSERSSSRLSHKELQSRIRERIMQLSRWEIDGLPIRPYMRHIPFAVPAKESQTQIERAIEGIWSTCWPLMGRPGWE